MTAAAFAFEPAREHQELTPQRPHLRLIQGGGSGTQGPVSLPVAPSTEIYRRRRFMALVGVTLLVLAIAWAMGISVLSFGAPSVDPLTEAAPAVHVVLPGDSYAAIATQFGLENPVEAAVQLRAANGGGELVAGERLVVDLGAFTVAGSQG